MSIIYYQYYTWWYFVGHLIAFGAVLKGRKKISHVGIGFEYRGRKYVAESKGHGIKVTPRETLFKINGCIHEEVISINKEDEGKIRDYVFHHILGEKTQKYSAFNAVLAYLDGDILDKIKRKKGMGFCSSFVVRAAQLISFYKDENPFEITPAELFEKGHKPNKIWDKRESFSKI